MDDIFLSKLCDAVKNSWSKETCYHDFLWNDKSLSNSAGHCMVTSLIVQDYLGGEVYYSYANGNKDWDHYWNLLDDGNQIDLTRDQFPKNVKFEVPIVVSRENILNDSVIKKTYPILKQRVKDYLKLN